MSLPPICATVHEVGTATALSVFEALPDVDDPRLQQRPRDEGEVDFVKLTASRGERSMSERAVRYRTVNAP